MSRMIWKGAIAFGLVQIPVSLYPAVGTHELQLSLLDRRDFAPVGYQRINATTGEAIAAADVVRGYEYAQGKYVAVSEEDLRQANVAAVHTVEISGFIKVDEIPAHYFDTPYYLEPGAGGERGYALLREALHLCGRVGLAKVVIRTRQHLAVVAPLGPVLALNTLRFLDEIHPTNTLNLPSENLRQLGIGSGEIEIATRLIDIMAEKWAPERYRDSYREDLLARIRQKLESGAVDAPPVTAEAATLAAEPKAAPAGAEIVDLMAVLKRSLEAERAARRTSAHGKPPDQRRA